MNKVGRRQWVYTIESLLYTFNIQCKFMMPCKHPLPRLLTLDYFSNLRGFASEVFAATNDVTDLAHRDIDKMGLQVLLRYFSMPSSIDVYFHKRKAN